MSQYVTFEDLVRFHKEVIAPHVEEGLAAKFFALDSKFEARFERLENEIVDSRRDMLTHFDMLYTRLDRLAVDYESFKSGLRRVEDRVTKLEKHQS